jgi:hypothetical protein
MSDENICILLAAASEYSVRFSRQLRTALKVLYLKKSIPSFCQSPRRHRRHLRVTDWMHDTARCLGYPSDSSRAARERARETSWEACAASPFARVACSFLRPSPVWLTSLTWPDRAASTLACAASLLARVAYLFASTLACAASLLARAAYLFARVAHLAPRPCGLPLRSCGSPLSHLAGVGQRLLAISHGCLVGLLVGVLDRRPVSPLPSTSACSGAGSGWHGCGCIADSAVYSTGLLVGPARVLASS